MASFIEKYQINKLFLSHQAKMFHLKAFIGNANVFMRKQQ